MQLDLLAYGARTTDPETSHLAAVAHPVVRVNDRELALAALRDAGPDGLTDFELAELTGRQPTSIGCRRKELCGLELVEWAGITRPSPSGSAARVWRIVP